MWKNFVDFDRVDNEEIVSQSRAQFQNNPGYIHITNIRILWTPPATKKPRFALPFQSIKGFQIASNDNPQSSPLLRVSSIDSTEYYTFEFIDPLTKWEDLNGFKLLLEQGTKPYFEKRKKTLLEKKKVHISRQRADLLARNDDLRLIHTKLVPNTLSEEEFWASRSDMIEKENIVQEQRIGMSSAMLTDLKPASETNRLVYRLTPQVIHQIFVEYPSVLQVYEEHVPHKISEKEFWERYFQSNYFHRTREQNTSSKQLLGRVTRGDYDDMFFQCENVREDTVPSINLSSVDHTVDLSLEEDMSDGFGVPLDKKMHNSVLEQSIALIRRYNRHSVLVLENPSIHQNSQDNRNQKKDKESKDFIGLVGQKRRFENTEDEINRKRLCPGIAEQTTLQDLENEVKPATIPLKITDQRRYFQSSESNMMDMSESASLGEFNEVLSEWNCNIEDCEIPEELSSQVLSNITAPKSRAVEGEAKDVGLNDEYKAKLRADFLECNELLRHFWGTFPLRSKEQQRKAKRLEQALTKYYKTLEQKRTTHLKSSKEQEKEYGILLFPITKSVCKAIEYFDSTKLAKQSN